MATYTFSGSAGFKMSQWGVVDIIGIVENVTSTHTATQVVYNDGCGEVLTLNGTFGGFDVDGDPTTGTVTSYSYSTSRFGAPATISGTGLSLSVPSLINLVFSENVGALQSALFDGADSFTGSNFSDVLNGYGGVDTLNGGLGDDILDGGAGKDTLNGGAGADQLFSQDVDILDGGVDEDYLHLNRSGSATAFAINAADLASAAGVTLADGTTVKNVEHFELLLGSGDDQLTLTSALTTGGFGPSVYNGGAGLDRLTADFSVSSVAIQSVLTWTNVEVVSLHAGSGADVFVGGTGDDTLFGGAGADQIDGGSGNDAIFGEDGDDIITLSGGFDFADGGAGTDTLRVDFSAANAPINYGINGFVAFEQNFESYVFQGGSGVDTFTLTGPALPTAPITLNGQLTDILAADFSTAVVAVTLDGNFLASGGTSLFVGSIGNFHVTGGAGNDDLSGSVGDDILFGGAGDDILGGPLGNDTLNGGDGNDTFRFGSNTRQIDGGAGIDTVSLSLDFATAGVSIDQNTLAAGLTTPHGGHVINVERFGRLELTAFEDTLDLRGDFYSPDSHFDGRGGFDNMIADFSARGTGVVFTSGSFDDNARRVPHQTQCRHLCLRHCRRVQPKSERRRTGGGHLDQFEFSGRYLRCRHLWIPSSAARARPYPRAEASV